MRPPAPDKQVWCAQECGVVSRYVSLAGRQQSTLHDCSNRTFGSETEPILIQQALCEGAELPITVYGRVNKWGAKIEYAALELRIKAVLVSM
jgi:hypothetical protein